MERSERSINNIRVFDFDTNFAMDVSYGVTVSMASVTNWCFVVLQTFSATTLGAQVIVFGGDLFIIYVVGFCVKYYSYFGLHMVTNMDVTSTQKKKKKYISATFIFIFLKQTHERERKWDFSATAD